MQKRRLGRTDIEVSTVGLGTATFGDRTDLAGARSVVGRALDLGVNLIDTADKYGTPRGRAEEFIGEILGARRKDVVLATKFGLPMNGPDSGGASAKYAIEALDASLRRLRTDYVDLFQMHYPDPKTPIDETLGALDKLVKQGKVRAIGCANFSLAQITSALDTSSRHNLAPFATCQSQLSLLARDQETALPAIEKSGLSFLPFYPLAAGMLSGKYRRGNVPKESRLSRPDMIARFHTDWNWSVVEQLRNIAARSGHSMIELSIGWLLSQRGVASVIAGAVTAEQIEANVAAAGRVPSREVLAEVDTVSSRHHDYDA